MNLTRSAVRLLRVLLVLLFLAAAIGQTLSWPGKFAYMAREDPDLAHLRWPLTAVAVLGLLAVEVVIVCIWKLLTLVTAGRIFSTDAFVWVDTIVWSLATAWVLLGAGSFAIVLTLYVTPELRDPGMPMMLAGVVLAAGVPTLLMVVMRTLLRQAAALRTDLDAVI